MFLVDQCQWRGDWKFSSVRRHKDRKNETETNPSTLFPYYQTRKVTLSLWVARESSICSTLLGHGGNGVWNFYGVCAGDCKTGK